MKTIPLFDDDKHIWEIDLLADDNGNCELLDFVDKLNVIEKSEWFALVKKLEYIANIQTGPRALGDKFVHELGSSKYKIFRFSQGSLRVSWFYGDGNKLILCAHAYVKKSNKTSRKDIEKAEGYYEAYYNR